MKKSAALFLVCALLLTLSASSFSLGLGTMSSTFTLGPFSIETNMPVMSRTDTKAETIGENYGLVSIAGFVTDDLAARVSRKKLDEASIQYMAAKLKESNITATVYRNPHDLYGLYYIQNIDSSRVLTMMMVSGVFLKMFTYAVPNQRRLAMGEMRIMARRVPSTRDQRPAQKVSWMLTQKAPTTS